MSTVLWCLTTGAQFVLVWWYRSAPVFYLPKGYLPGVVGWWFSLPFAPKGACLVPPPSLSRQSPRTEAAALRGRC